MQIFLGGLPCNNDLPSPKIWVPRDQPLSGFSLQRVSGGSGSENSEYQVGLGLITNE
jgi:hypothetical protein